MAVAHSKWMQADPPSSRASLAPTGDWGQPAHPGTPPDPWEPSLLAIAVAHSKWMQADPPSSRASPLPQGIGGNRHIRVHHRTCGSRACSRYAIAVAHSKWTQADPPSSRASLAPTGDWGQPAHPGTPPDLWELSLLAMAVAHSKWMQADPPSSRAGSLPQGIGGNRHIQAHHRTRGSRACSR